MQLNMAQIILEGGTRSFVDKLTAETNFQADLDILLVFCVVPEIDQEHETHEPTCKD